MCVTLGSRIAEDLVAVGVESHAPEADRAHQLLGLVEFAVAAEDRVHELAAAIATHVGRPLLARLALRRLPHVLLADFEQLLEAHPQPLAALQEVLDHLPVLFLPDLVDALVRALDFARELDK